MELVQLVALVPTCEMHSCCSTLFPTRFYVECVVSCARTEMRLDFGAPNAASRSAHERGDGPIPCMHHVDTTPCLLFGASHWQFASAQLGNLCPARSATGTLRPCGTRARTAATTQARWPPLARRAPPRMAVKPSSPRGSASTSASAHVGESQFS